MNIISRRRSGRLIIRALALFLSQLAMHAGPNKGAGSAGFPEVNLPAVARGPQAQQTLGVQLPEVARAYGWREEELRSLLLRDHTLAVDHRGRLHYTDPAPPQGALAAASDVPQAALAPLADTFKLHSRSGAKRIIYLDFDGHVISGTGWNTSYNAGHDIVAPPWDLDGDPTSFSDTERTRIQQIWQRVAEDYAPFDVDVTTELTSESLITRSSSSDEYYGARVLISAISSYFGGYGGIAYIGSFDDVGDQYKPALVFPENLGPNGEKYIAEAASHECGHNLGLNHDGTTTGSSYYNGQGSGATGWAPIMGVGYYQNLSQWSKGEYANANNKQDDLAIIQTYGLSYRIDDHGNTAATASYFPAGIQLSANGVIERSTDVDVFAFTTGAGTISISVTGSEVGPNLDVYAELRDAGGSLIAASNPADQLSALFNVSVPAGTYFVHVSGTGWGDPLSTGYSNYGSLGHYLVAGTVINPGAPVAPVANASAAPTSGFAPLAVQFNGSTSFDQDGSVVSHVWNFGDGVTASGAVVNHIYAAAGVYIATLTVTDNSGLSDTATLTIQAQNPNTAPVARISASPTSGTAPLTVSFDGSTSSDLEGALTSYQWNFGDGTTGSGAVVQHTYQSVDTFTATLTVTDSGGASASASVLIQVTPTAATIVRVQSISVVAVRQKSGDYALATVKVTDPSGKPVAGVAVSGNFNSVVSGTVTGTTDANGNVALASRRSKRNAVVTFTVTNLAKTGSTYDPSQNVTSWASVSL